MIRTVLRLARDRSGAIMVVMGLAAPVVALGVSAAVEYGNLITHRARLQKAVDAGATAAGKQLTLFNNTDTVVVSTARSVALGTLADYASTNRDAVTISATIQNNRKTVAVQAVETVSSLMGRLLTLPGQTVSAKASATVFGETKLCILVLEPSQDNAMQLQDTAQVSAPQCSAYSNSASALGITAVVGASMRASGICSAGGYVSVLANLSPTPQTGCAPIADPLSNRNVSASSMCDYTDKSVDGGTVTLTPGVYCNGLKISKDAVVTLAAGTYTIDGGQLLVDGNATMQGTDVGIFLRGDKATIKFDKDSTINLTAPRSGDMAGFLIFEDRSAPLLREHKISSDNARQLLGTIYLPRGSLKVDAKRPVADQSAYTVIVARQVKLKNSPNLVMNAMYANSNVPVPDGVGPRGANVALSQ